MEDSAAWEGLRPEMLNERKKRSIEWMDELADDVGEGVLGEAVDG